MVSLYLECFAVGILGMLIHIGGKIKSIQDKARIANVSFKPIDYFTEDWLSMGVSVVTIFMAMFFISDVLHLKPEVLYYVKFGFAFIGYTGSDIASRLFGAVNKRVNQVIDKKTTIADEATGEQNQTPHK